MQLETSDYTASVMLNYSLVGALLDAAPATPGARYVRDSSSDVRRAPFGYHAPRWRMSVGLLSVASCDFEARFGDVPGARRAQPPDAGDPTAWAYDGCDDLSRVRDRGNCFPALCDGDWTDMRQRGAW